MQAVTDWRPPPTLWMLPDNAVHLWQVDLHLAGRTAAALSELLADDERERAARWHFAADRQRYCVARGALRVILGQYLSLPPTQVRFTYGPNGRPEPAADLDYALRFNVSHSGALALIAVTRGRALGVDVEAIRPVTDADDLIRQYGSRAEQRAHQSLPASQQLIAFFNLWTRKEAYLKAIGLGLAGGLAQVEVTLRPDQPAQFISLPPDWAETQCWRLWAGQPQPGYVAALAVHSPDWELACWQWDERCLTLMET